MSMTVVLADDHAVVREGLRLILEASGDITVVGEAADGREAVRVSRELQPNVVVMDISMEGLNGIDATSQIRERCRSTQVVVLSMHGTSEHVSRAFRAGATGYVLKESAGAEIVAAVRAAHIGRRYLSNKIADLVFRGYVTCPGSGSARGAIESLSQREREVVQLVAEGKTSKEIGAMVHLSPKTVETYRSRAMRKLGVQGLANLVKFAIEHGLTTPS